MGTPRLLTLEKRYWEALKNRDVSTMESLTADPCLVVGPQGARSVPRTQFREMAASDDFKIKSFQIDERNASIRSITDNVAAVAYPVHEELERGGKTETLDAFATSVWTREGGRWVCAVHTESPAMAARRQ